MLRVILLVILFIITLHSNSIEKADKYYESGKIIKALKIYKSIARSGDTSVYFKLGTIYYKGDVIQKNIKKAMYYFKLASSYGNKKAKYNMAIIYSQKKSIYHNYKKAYSLFLDLAQMGYVKAQIKVGQYLLYGIGIQSDYSLAKRWFEQAYFHGKNKEASCNLAYIYVEGKGVFVNLGRARKLVEDKYIKKNDLVGEIRTSLCQKIFKQYKLYKYNSDKGFKLGYYK